MRVECGVSLAFLVPNKPSSDNDDMAAGDVWSRVTCAQIVGSAGCVSFCLFSANWPNEISLVVWLQVKGSEQFGDCPTSRILFMHDCNLEVSGNFFPRVRTPCGHGAQVIIEGREIQSDFFSTSADAVWAWCPGHR